MAVKLSDLSFIRRSPAEISVLRELIWLQRAKEDPVTEGYLTVVCQMQEEQLRKALDKLAKGCLISYTARQLGAQGQKATFYDYDLHYRRIHQLIVEGEAFVRKTLKERYENSQRGTEAASVGKSTTENEGEIKEAKTPVAETLATNPKAIPDPVIMPSMDAPEVLDGLSLFQKQPKYKGLSWKEAWVEFCRSDPWSWIKKAKDAKAAKRRTDKS
jgi:hypothetical protein